MKGLMYNSTTKDIEKVYRETLQRNAELGSVDNEVIEEQEAIRGSSIITGLIKIFKALTSKKKEFQTFVAETGERIPKKQMVSVLEEFDAVSNNLSILIESIKKTTNDLRGETEPETETEEPKETEDEE